MHHLLMRGGTIFAVSLVALGLAGCGSSKGATDGGGSNDAGVHDGGCGPVSWDSQVQPIIQTYCLTCHGDPAAFGAPHPLASYGDTQKLSVEQPDTPVYTLMANKVASGQMPPSGARPTPDEVQLINAWAAAGAPQSACPGTDGGTCDAGPVADSGTIDLTGAAFEGTAQDFVITPDAGNASNLYHCFAFTVHTEDGGPRTLTEFGPVVDNSQILHHMILYRLPTGGAPATDYDCFGGPGPDDAQFIYAWAPGIQPYTLPSDVGFPVKDGDQYVLQTHYHNFTGASQTDNSGVAFWWTDQPRQHSAQVIALGNDSFTIPAGSADFEVTGTCTNPASYDVTFNVFAALPHMHTHGSHIDTVNTHPDGGSELLVETDNWSFDDQQVKPVSMQVFPGDVLTTHCHYNTTTSSTSISFGEDTEDEMCFDFLYLYPNVDITVPGYCLQ
ncbi:MAG: hypothetical protein JST54_00590 [Deltaproteobacteria bacterium]|nr:hypothetical protein [Deltaproteobacteria bacterium]